LEIIKLIRDGAAHCVHQRFPVCWDECAARCWFIPKTLEIKFFDVFNFYSGLSAATAKADFILLRLEYIFCSLISARTSGVCIEQVPLTVWRITSAPKVIFLHCSVTNLRVYHIAIYTYILTCKNSSSKFFENFESPARPRGLFCTPVFRVWWVECVAISRFMQKTLKNKFFDVFSFYSG